MSDIPSQRHPGGRPTKYRPDLASSVLSAIASGITITDAASKHGIHIDTIYEWSDRHSEFSEGMARARERSTHVFAAQVLEIADNTSRDYVEYVTKSGDIRLAPNHAAATRDRLRVETRKWLMEKWNPRAYGDTQRVELTGANGGPILLEQITLLAVQRLEAEKVSAQRGPQVIDNTADQPGDQQLTHTPAHTKHER